MGLFILQRVQLPCQSFQPVRQEKTEIKPQGIIVITRPTCNHNTFALIEYVQRYFADLRISSAANILDLISYIMQGDYLILFQNSKLAWIVDKITF